MLEAMLEAHPLAGAEQRAVVERVVRGAGEAPTWVWVALGSLP